MTLPLPRPGRAIPICAALPASQSLVHRTPCRSGAWREASRPGKLPTRTSGRHQASPQLLPGALTSVPCLRVPRHRGWPDSSCLPTRPWVSPGQDRAGPRSCGPLAHCVAFHLCAGRLVCEVQVTKALNVSALPWGRLSEWIPIKVFAVSLCPRASGTPGEAMTGQRTLSLGHLTMDLQG